MFARVHCVVLKQSATVTLGRVVSPGVDGCVFHSVSVVIALGKRPVTFRTRKLSLSAPMVLQGGPCGRVGRRRTIFMSSGPPFNRGARAFFALYGRSVKYEIRPVRPAEWRQSK